jgi:5-methylcytosine-specific restriction endonuclease McrA
MATRAASKRRADATIRREIAALEGFTSEKALRRRKRLLELLALRGRRAALVARLGGVCACCGSAKDLELDHYPERARVELRRMSQGQRQREYEREAERGNLRLLCSRCNGSAGGCFGNLANIARQEGTPLLCASE